MFDAFPDRKTRQQRLANFEREAGLLAVLSYPFIPDRGNIYIACLGVIGTLIARGECRAGNAEARCAYQAHRAGVESVLVGLTCQE
jgi:hypothetical protein